MTKRNYMGDSIGVPDEDGIAEWYPNCKVRFDGSFYIATPHTTNPTRRKKRKEEIVTISEQDGKLKLENPPPVPELDNDDDIAPPKLQQVTLEEVIEKHEKSPPEHSDEPEKNIKRTTRKQVFNELYDKYLNINYKKRKKVITEEMQALFKTEVALQSFIEENFHRRWRNIVARRQRFVQKALNQNFRYFATFTYADEKHTEESFKKRLLETLRRLSTRHNWKYMGVWERGKDTNRLHFHALVDIPDGEMVGSFEDLTDYNKKTGKQKTITQNTFFAEKFGRNEFDDIGGVSYLYGKAIAYLMKYMEKQNARVVCSKGLYQYFRTDVQGKDVVGKMSAMDETDNKLILAPHFTCWDEGVKIGEVSPETIALLPKSG